MSNWIEAGKDVIDLMNKGSYGDVVSKLNDAMAGAMNAEHLKQMWEGIQGQIGAFAAIEDTHLIEEDGYHVSLLKIRFEKSEMVARIVFNDEGQIAGLYFQPKPGPPPVAAAEEGEG